MGKRKGVQVIDEHIVGVGWDVRGWLSRDQATAVARLRRGSGEVEWLGISEPFRFAVGSVPGFIALTEPAVGAETSAELSSSPKLALAIDAPLSFPKDFRSLLEGKWVGQVVPAEEIESRLAYRDCERWVKRKFEKKPLSAPFDKLGNNASLAMSVAGQLQREGYMLVPQTTKHAVRAVIEVYPSLVKTGPRKVDPVIPELERYIPGDLEVGTDRYDAASCALLALLFLGGGAELALPDLEPFPDNADPKEGWIFALPPNYMRGR